MGVPHCSAGPRHNIGTHLSPNGLIPPTAWAHRRHSTLDPTMLARRGENVYTDPSLLDVAGALESLPILSLAPLAAAAGDESPR